MRAAGSCFDDGCAFVSHVLGNVLRAALRMTPAVTPAANFSALQLPPPRLIIEPQRQHLFGYVVLAAGHSAPLV